MIFLTKILNFLTIFILCCLIVGITIMLVILFFNAIIGIVTHALVGNFILSLCYFLFLCFLISLIIVMFKEVP